MWPRHRTPSAHTDAAEQIIADFHKSMARRREEETGKVFRITRERIRQIEAVALRKLRGPQGRVVKPGP